ncbi:MAG: hypothetical protein A2934_03890 [Candidatus Sungbacteria bacterium RIFCSPLOWO2_01_FULL_47_10]|uniref:NADH:quinone oxidoreductase/Mrp antiporter transmembrane domain-containing protein n=1 Tax=Candidatus Sungbacteria bacterium RIFCSPLOWO2_01_FULL_47_10 TaxID=1802276 RepID=A0A1G2L8C3_9BACT|nr:MAG: hypothetical protein A2934_03890 [Candidatus Sungbacteria bacterium RIFCSPLOWO2_01_FULL_47_10]
MILPFIIFIYALGGIACLVFPKEKSSVIARVTAGILLIIGFATLPSFMKNELPMAFDFSAPWISALGSGIHFGTDGISYPLILLTLFLGFVSALLPYPHNEPAENARFYWALILWLLSAVVGVFASLDLLLFYIFWEIVLILMFFLIALYGGENRKYASMKFLIYTQFASLVMLLGIIALYLGSGGFTFDIMTLRTLEFSQSLAFWVVAALLFSFFVKIPAVPFHTWLPDAHVEAPTAGSVLLAGLLLKMGAYGILRIPFTIFPDALYAIAVPLGIFAFVSILYGAFVSLAQDNLKRMIAYSSVNHMGYVLLGIATLSPMGIHGAVYEMVAHGFGAGLLFATAGFIHDKYKTFSIPELRGLMKSVPVVSWFFIIGALAAMGLPTMAGFIAEFTIFVAAFQVYHAWILLPLVAVVVTAGYFIWTVQRSMWGDGGSSDISEPKRVLYWTPYILLTLGLFVLGLVPSLLFSILDTGMFIFR